MKTKNAWNGLTKAELTKVDALAKEYMEFLNEGKTERECVNTIVNTIEKEGFVELKTIIDSKKKLKAGDRVYCVTMNKTVAMFIIGKQDMAEGMNILGAHIDSPRLDIKQNPLYEDKELAYLDTHYYGGIKKYQWVTIPLAIHGVIVKKDGTTVEVSVGEDEGDPVFFVSDLLIHLAQDQLEKKATTVVEGEALDIIIGNKPIVINDSKKKDDKEEAKEGSELVKKNILSILKDTYNVEEEDFLSAELEVVPAGKAREAGFDRSMILGYGQDDRVCAFPSMKAMFDIKIPNRTSCCLLVDKEEIGSVGATGMRSKFFENTVAYVMDACGTYSELNVRKCLANSCMLSSDVSAAFDPSYASAFEAKNAAYLSHGIVLNKFTGSRGKSGSNDANAEYIAHIRDIFDNNKVVFQTSELGKVDKGGGGTIAYILALYGMNVIDSGAAVLNMHAPWEATSKVDMYEMLKGYTAFLKDAQM